MAKNTNNSGAHQHASKLAQLLGEVIIHHAPWTSEVAEQTKRRITDDWLENLEKHATTVVAPIIDQVLANSDPPDEIAHLLQAAHTPSAQFGSTIQQFFVWGVMFSLASTALAPFTQVVANDLWKANPTRPLSPADIATALTQAVNWGDSQGVEVPQWAIDMAKESGLNEDAFRTLVGVDGVAPDPTALFEMFRRKIIDDTQFTNGFLEGPTKNKWIPFLQKLRYEPLTISDMVRAAVQEQLPYDVAEELAHSLGLEPTGFVNDNPDWFKVAFDIAGRPPGPVEMGHAANRGIIPWDGQGADVTSFQQAIAESDVKTKWTPILKALAQYFPPPGEVRTLLMHGGITHAQAVELWKQGGIPDTLAEAYAHIAEVEQLTQDRQLSKGEILQALQESLISESEAEQALDAIGYRGDTAKTLLKLGQWRYNLQTLRASVKRISNLYTTFKLTAADTQKAFESIGIPTNQARALLSSLEAQRNSEVMPLTTAQVVEAWGYDILTQDEAMTYLQQLGMRPWDAWARLSIKAKGPLPNEPQRPRSEGGG